MNSETNDEKSLLGAFGKAVFDQRKALRLSQEELASRAGVHRTYLSDIERGGRNVSLTVINRLAQALGTKLGPLFAQTEREMPRASDADEVN